MDPSFTASVLPEARLRALDDALASMEAVLNLVRCADGDGRGVMPWMEDATPRLCQQVCAALDLYAGELGEDIDAEEVRAVIAEETGLMRALEAQAGRLRRVLALTEEACHAVGSDVMQLAMELHCQLAQAGRADRITALSDARRERQARRGTG